MEAPAVGHVSTAAVQRMRLKAAQLAEELRHAQTGGQPELIISTTVDVSQHTRAAGRAAGTPQVQVVAEQAQAAQALLQASTPAVFRRLSKASVNTCKPSDLMSTAAHQAAALQCSKLEAEVLLWKGKFEEAAKELDRRQASYMRREEQLKKQLEDIDKQSHRLDSSCVNSNSLSEDASEQAPVKVHNDHKLLTLQEMQQQVLHGLDDLLQRQKLQMRAEEAQQLRQFRSKLAELEGQMQADKQASAAHQDSWMGKTLALREELAKTQEIASKLDAMYKLQEQEAVELRVQFRAQEDDRQHLIRQLLASKRENTRLRQEVTALEEELEAVILLASAATDSASGAVQSSGPGGTTASHHTADNLAAAIATTWQVASGRASSIPALSAEPGSAVLLRSRPSTGLPDSRQQSQAHTQTPPRPWSAAGAMQHSQQAQSDNLGQPEDAVVTKMQRYGHVIVRLQKLLETERRQVRQVRSKYAAELGRRNELQTLLLDSIQQVKQQQQDACAAHQQVVLGARCARDGFSVTVNRQTQPHIASSQQKKLSRPSSAAAAALGAVSNDPPHMLDKQTWEELLNHLLARREVLELVYNQAFPEWLSGNENLLQRHAAGAEYLMQQGSIAAGCHAVNAQQGSGAMLPIQRPGTAALQQQQQEHQQQEPVIINDEHQPMQQTIARVDGCSSLEGCGDDLQDIGGSGVSVDYMNASTDDEANTSTIQAAASALQAARGTATAAGVTEEGEAATAATARAGKNAEARSNAGTTPLEQQLPLVLPDAGDPKPDMLVSSLEQQQQVQEQPESQQLQQLQQQQLQSQQQQQQHQSHKTAMDCQPAIMGTIPLASMSGPVMPGFPVRRPLHQTPLLQWPHSGPPAVCRPASAAACSAAHCRAAAAAPVCQQAASGRSMQATARMRPVSAHCTLQPAVHDLGAERRSSNSRGAAGSCPRQQLQQQMPGLLGHSSRPDSAGIHRSTNRWSQLA